MADATRRADHAAAALARLPAFLRRNQPVIDLLNTVNAETQALEDAIWQLFPGIGMGVTAAQGVNLDIIGRVLDQARGNSANDDEYKRRLLARILSNISCGTGETIYKIFRALLGTSPSLQFRNEPTAGWTIVVSSYAMPPSEVDLLLMFMAAAKLGGVYAVMEFDEAIEEATFTCALSQFFQGTVASGATRIDVLDTSKFPAAGNLTLDQGTSIAEDITYAYKLPASFEGCSALAHTHTVRGQIAWKDSPGVGFGSTLDLTIGGQFASARGAR